MTMYNDQITEKSDGVLSPSRTSCTTVQPLMSDFLHGKLAPPLERAVDLHIESCPECLGSLERLADTPGAREVDQALEGFFSTIRCAVREVEAAAGLMVEPARTPEGALERERETAEAMSLALSAKSNGRGTFGPDPAPAPVPPTVVVRAFVRHLFAAICDPTHFWTRAVVQLRSTPVLHALLLAALFGSLLGMVVHSGGSSPLLAFGIKRQLLGISHVVTRLFVHSLSMIGIPFVIVAFSRTVLKDQDLDVAGDPASGGGRWSWWLRLVGLSAVQVLMALVASWLVFSLLGPGRTVDLRSEHPLPSNGPKWQILLSLGLATVAYLRWPGQDVRMQAEAAYRFLCRVLNFMIALTPIFLFFSLVETVGPQGLQRLVDLGDFVISVLLGLTILSAALLLFTGRRKFAEVKHLVVATGDALFAAAGTASSGATMPLTHSLLVLRAGISERAASAGVYMGTSLTKEGTALFVSMSTLFMAQWNGVSLGVREQFAVALGAVVISLFAAAIPQASLALMMLMFGYLGIAPEQALLFLPVNFLLDPARTAVNVWGKICLSCALDTGPRAGDVGEDGAGESPRPPLLPAQIGRAATLLPSPA